MTTTQKLYRVNILDHSGNVLADIDGSSTTDALAYYLTSRKIDTDATSDKIRMAIWMGEGWDGSRIPDDMTIVRTVTDPISRIQRDITAVVH